jgi:demethylmenaquinone methyltransferase/2-methoxy-6-polyprenyl-1,4-benzoquinol methylase
MNNDHKQKNIKNENEKEDLADYGYRKVKASEKVHLVLRHFNSIASKYDFMNTLLSFGLHYHWKHVAIRLLNLKEGDTVIDVCGGTADLALMAGRCVGPSGSVFVYDINKAMMDVGKQKIADARQENTVACVLGNAEIIGFNDNSFDAATVGFGVRNLTHMEKGLEEMYRVLKSSGTFMCLEFSRPTAPVFRQLYDFYSFYIMPILGAMVTGSRQAYTYLPESIRLFPSPDKLKAKLEAIGFKDVTYRKLTNGIAVIHMGTKP